MRKDGLLILCLLSIGCRYTGQQELAVTLSNDVPVTHNTIALDGFIISGGFSENQHDAAKRHSGACNAFSQALHQTLEGFRLDSRIDCGVPTNESPFGLGFMYVSRPQVIYKVDAEDEVEWRDGDDISGEEADQAHLDWAFTSFNDACMAKILAYKSQFGAHFIAADCGKPVVKNRMAFHQHFQQTMPNLSVSSKMRIFVRKGQEPASPIDTLTLKPLLQIPLFDPFNGMATANDGKTIYTVGFSGNISKIDMQNSKIIWDKNLTNPSPDSIKETTALNVVAVPANGKFVAVGADYGYLALLDAMTGHKMAVLSCRDDMFAPEHYVALNFDQSGRSLFSAAQLTSSPDNSTGYNRLRFPSENDSTQLNHRLVRWNAETGGIAWQTEVKTGHILSLGFNPDETFLYVISTSGVLLFDAKTGKPHQEFLLATYEGALKNSFISGASFSSDMRLLAISAFSGVILVDTQTAKLLKRLRASLATELGNPSFSPDAKTLTAADAYGGIFRWNTLNGHLIAKGRNENLMISYNGPYNMPLRSSADGTILWQSAPSFNGGGGIFLPPLQHQADLSPICKAGDDADLPALRIRKGGQLAIWAIFVGSDQT